MNSAGLKSEIHPKFLKFIEICKQLDFATIEKLEIQAGLPVFMVTEEGTIVIPGASVKKKHKL